MSYKARILDHLWSAAPAGATSGQSARALGIASQQTVCTTTQELAGRRNILHAGSRRAPAAGHVRDHRRARPAAGEDRRARFGWSSSSRRQRRDGIIALSAPETLEREAQAPTLGRQLIRRAAETSLCRSADQKR
jgi:hypothetical protein